MPSRRLRRPHPPSGARGADGHRRLLVKVRAASSASRRLASSSKTTVFHLGRGACVRSLRSSSFPFFARPRSLERRYLSNLPGGDWAADPLRLSAGKARVSSHAPVSHVARAVWGRTILVHAHRKLGAERPLGRHGVTRLRLPSSQTFHRCERVRLAAASRRNTLDRSHLTRRSDIAVRGEGPSCVVQFVARRTQASPFHPSRSPAPSRALWVTEQGLLIPLSPGTDAASDVDHDERGQRRRFALDPYPLPSFQPSTLRAAQLSSERLSPPCPPRPEEPLRGPHVVRFAVVFASPRCRRRSACALRACRPRIVKRLAPRSRAVGRLSKASSQGQCAATISTSRRGRR